MAKTRTKKIQPSKTAIRKILSECAFDPRAVGPLKVIADVGDAKYYVTRAQETIVGTLAEVRPVSEVRNDLKNAISLLALSLVNLPDNG